MSDWRFLDEWFLALKGTCTVERLFDSSPWATDSDAVRLGRDDDELWIDVRIDDDAADDAAQRTARCLALHEALVLTSVVAVVDYNVWRNALASICELVVPAAVDPDATLRRLQPQYRVALPAKYSWTNIQQIIAGDKHRSDRFCEHYTMMMETAGRLNVPLDDGRPFRVHVLATCPERMIRTLQAEWIRSVIDTVVALDEKEDDAAGQRTLQLDSIALNLQNFDIHSSVFQEVLGLVETGVRITSLGMPLNYLSIAGKPDLTRDEMWALLLCAVCGCPQRPTRKPVRVEKLALDMVYDLVGLLPQLLSCLSQAHSLRSLKMSVSCACADPLGMFWTWLGATVFRSDSQCAVEVLTLDMVSLTTPAMDCLREAMEAPDPLALLWEKTTLADSDVCGAQTTRREIVVPAGAIVHVYGTGRGYAVPVAVPLDWRGVVVQDDSPKATLGVLLCGIGFCEVDRALLPNKHPRVEPESTLGDSPAHHPSNVRTLCLSVEASEGEDEDGAPLASRGVDALLELVGESLTALSLTDRGMDDELLRSCLEKCPHLQSLRVERCRLRTMDPIVQSYMRGGQISSLDLTALKVSSSFLPEFEAFLSLLLIPSAMKRTLKKLRIGTRWASLFRQSTADLLKQVLDDPRTLDYLHLHRCENPRVAPAITWDIEKHHGTIIPVPGVPPLAVRVAFASVIRRRLALPDSDAVARVLEFVGQTKQRVVISEVDPYYNSRRFRRRR